MFPSYVIVSTSGPFSAFVDFVAILQVMLRSCGQCRDYKVLHFKCTAFFLRAFVRVKFSWSAGCLHFNVFIVLPIISAFRLSNSLMLFVPFIF